MRIEIAVRSLRSDPERSLTDLAAALGFSELSAFSHWFRGRFGKSPTAWRGPGTGPPFTRVCLLFGE
ncbi:helix-turn-helix domain-containing protein [Prescottella equi]|uniref:helix-turn-helix domain-containing protein n=1 Tax=Rhodococcus hoagii TaxID=43767 RepID=UPI003D99F166